MLTAGGVGSHHVLAAAVHGQRLGLDFDMSGLGDEQVTDRVRGHCVRFVDPGVDIDAVDDAVEVDHPHCLVAGVGDE